MGFLASIDQLSKLFSELKLIFNGHFVDGRPKLFRKFQALAPKRKEQIGRGPPLLSFFCDHSRARNGIVVQRIMRRAGHVRNVKAVVR